MLSSPRAPAPDASAYPLRPVAQQLQSYGRGDDTVLVHMTPNEVNSLRGLAQQFGGDLTTNPHTGLPEAGWLGRLLPTILGVAGAAFGLPTWAVGLGVGVGKTAISGDINKGLLAGLEAFGGAGLGQAAGLGGKLGSLGADLGISQTATGASSALSNMTANAAGAPGLGQAAPGTLEQAFDKTFGVKAPGFLDKFAAETSLGAKGALGTALPFVAGASTLGALSDATAPKPAAPPGQEQTPYVPYGPGRRDVRFQSPSDMRRSGGAEFRFFTPTNPPPVPLYGDTRRYAEGGVATPPPSSDMNALVQYFGATSPGAVTAPFRPTAFTAPSGGTVSPSPTAPPIMRAEQRHTFARGPSAPTDMSVFGGLGALGGLAGLPVSGASLVPSSSRQRSSSRQTSGFGVPDMSIYGSPYLSTFAGGGKVALEDGSFVVDARTVSELGNGSSNAGMELLMRLGGRPVQGPGDGVSDSVPAVIDGRHPARVARDEVVFHPKALERLGGGDANKGVRKLYALMDKAHKARKKADRGEDTRVRKELA